MRQSYAKPPQGTTVRDYTSINNGRAFVLKSDRSVIISRGSLEDVRAKERGFKGRTDLNKVRQESEYKVWLTRSGEITADSKRREDFEKLYAAARADNDFGNKSPDGTLAKLLVFIGMRDENAQYPVGQTPSKRK